MKDSKPERELWLAIAGACLGGPAARKEALEGLDGLDPVDEDVRKLMAAIRAYDGKDGGKVKQSLEGFGVRVNGKLLCSVKERLAQLVRERRIREQLSRLSAAKLNDKVFWEEVEKLKKVLP